MRRWLRKDAAWQYKHPRDPKGSLDVAQDDRGLGVFRRWQANGRGKMRFSESGRGSQIFLLW
jgi:hypothetical protein